MYIKQNGAGFIEVLVALVILAIGLLGVLSMQARGLTSNQRALFASEVNLLAMDMADRILAYGIAGADSGEYDTLSTQGATTLADDVVADADRTAWINAMTASSLPSAIGDVAWVANADGGTYTISIRWDETREGVPVGTLANDCDTRPVLVPGSAQKLSCYQLTVTL